MGQQGRLEELFYRTDFVRHNILKNDDKSYRGCGHVVGHPRVAIFRGSCNEGYMKYDSSVQINLITAFMSTRAQGGDEHKMTRHNDMQQSYLLALDDAMANKSSSLIMSGMLEQHENNQAFTAEELAQLLVEILLKHRLVCMYHQCR